MTPGLHWFCVLKNKNSETEIFDPLGSSIQDVADKLKDLKGNVVVNTTCLQPATSSMCGEYCVYFVIHRMFNFDLEFEEVLNTVFTDNVQDNEENVRKFLETL